MFNLFATPDWFNHLDIIFTAVTLLISLLISAYGWKIYKLSSDRRFAYFSFSFLLVSLAFLFKLITLGNVYFAPVREITGEILRPITKSGGETYRNLFYRVGFFLQMASLLGSWLLIYLVSQKSRSRLKKYHELTQIGLFVYLVLLIAIVSTFVVPVFFVTSLVLLSLIVLNYYRNYLNTGKDNAWLVMVAFFLILLGHLAFIFIQYWEVLYFAGMSLMSLGFLLILIVYRMVTRA